MLESLSEQYKEYKLGLEFADNEVEMLTAPPNEKIPVLDHLRHPEDFHGDPNVDHVVMFKKTFEPLIGRYDEARFGPWDENALPKENIFVLEHHYVEAVSIMRLINELAQRIINDPKLYDDKSVGKDFYDLAQLGYRFLNKHTHEFGLDGNERIPISLERAGLVTTRLAKDLGQDAEVPNEVRVVTKRTHLKEEPESHLTVTVSWRDKEAMKNHVTGVDTEISDFVNPASGASTAAFVLAAKMHGVSPKTLMHRSISLTRQGTRFMQLGLKKIGIEPIFYSLGDCDEMTPNYYLVGKPVADAGHILRHFLPRGFQ